MASLLNVHELLIWHYKNNVCCFVAVWSLTWAPFGPVSPTFPLWPRSPFKNQIKKKCLYLQKQIKQPVKIILQWMWINGKNNWCIFWNEVKGQTFDVHFYRIKMTSFWFCHLQERPEYPESPGRQHSHELPNGEEYTIGHFKTYPCYCIRYENLLTLTLSPLEPIIPVIPLKPCRPYSNKTSDTLNRNTWVENIQTNIIWTISI